MTNHKVLGRRNQHCLIALTIITGFSMYYFGIFKAVVQKSGISLHNCEETISRKGFVVHTPGCKIPDMDPFDKSIRHCVVKTNFPVCNEIPPLIESNQTSIWVVEKVLSSYNVSVSSELECCYSELKRGTKVDKSKKLIDDSREISSNCIKFNNSANIPFEFIHVQCQVNGTVIYRDFHVFIVPKSKKYYQQTERNEEESSKDVSVLILGIDSMSRLNFHRNMPRTRNFMQYLGAIEFFGYNRLARNTFPNLVALLTGYFVEELGFCWPTVKSYLDRCPWIWKNFSAKNYVTAYAADSTWMGAFTQFRRGFRDPPTDYYGRTYLAAGESLIGSGSVAYTNTCIGHRYVVDVLLDYAYKFTVNMTLLKKKFWGIFWESCLTHDFVNVPKQTDDMFYDLFEKLLDNHVMDNTVVLFLSDHGFRWGDLRYTYQGSMEENLPFLYVILPDWFKARYISAVKNLESNAHLLTTHFDLYETMIDILNLDSLEPENLNSRAPEVHHKRSFSLFLPGSVQRTCESAGIQPIWCNCHVKKDISTTSSAVKRAALTAVDHINNLLKRYKECARLELNEITSAYVDSLHGSLQFKDPDSSIVNIGVTFSTVPGLAKFESVIRQRFHPLELSVLGEISRINRYGSQSKCISDVFLKLYCYCVSNLDTGTKNGKRR